MRAPLRRNARSGQATTEFALIYAGFILPLTFMIIFVAEIFWVWHGVTDMTRDIARYAATHCWMSDNSNITTYTIQVLNKRYSQVTVLANGSEGNLQVQYYSQDPDSGALSEFSCQGGDCSIDCVPDVVAVSFTNVQFAKFAGYLKLPPVTMPDFRTVVPVESAGCDEGGNCSQ